MLVQLVQIVKSGDYGIEQKECNEIRLSLGGIITSWEIRYQPSIELETPPVHISSSLNNTKKTRRRYKLA